MSEIYDDFMSEFVTLEFALVFAKYVSEFNADHSKWIYVDGEEGDYGHITYSNAQGVEICRAVSTGGDNDWYEFTDVGKKELLKLLAKTLIDQL